LEILTSVLSVAYQVILQTSVRNRRNQKKKSGYATIVTVSLLPDLGVWFMKKSVQINIQMHAIGVDEIPTGQRAVMLKHILRVTSSKNGNIPSFCS